MRRMTTAGLVVLGIFLMGPHGVRAADLEAGKAFYEEKRCGVCHFLEGKGGKVASDLSGVGSRRDGEWLLKFLKDPKKVADAKMMPVKGTEEELAHLVAYLLSHK